ncbi:MAG TPA: methyltransferase domain-containing protein [Caulobacteraceae bacterium]|jgi:SAM-dependent methyltransferase
MTALDAAGPNAAQVTYWNETAGANWVAMQDALDQELVDLGLAAMATLAPKEGERLIDIGCGCGATALELARRVGNGGAVLGADISAPMLAVARERAQADGLQQVRFVQADAQVHAFEPADGAFSRFGVMFFADPVAAFANIRRSLMSGGRAAFICWRQPSENPWMTMPVAAVAPLLPAPPATAAPGAPGPFAFADRDRLFGILLDAGFADVSIEPHDARLGWGDLETSVRMGMRLGPVSGAVREHPHLRDAMADAVRAALAPHADADGVKLDSGTWIVRAA